MKTIADFAPMVLPSYWKETVPPPPILNQFGPHLVKAYVKAQPPMSLFLSLEDRGADTGLWLHLSLAHPRRMPTWLELKDAKELFIGDVAAVQLLPPRSSYLNVHNFCLHLFRRVDQPTVPEDLWRAM